MPIAIKTHTHTPKFLERRNMRPLWLYNTSRILLGEKKVNRIQKNKDYFEVIKSPDPVLGPPYPVLIFKKLILD